MSDQYRKPNSQSGILLPMPSSTPSFTTYDSGTSFYVILQNIAVLRQNSPPSQGFHPTNSHKFPQIQIHSLACHSFMLHYPCFIALAQMGEAQKPNLSNHRTCMLRGRHWQNGYPTLNQQIAIPTTEAASPESSPRTVFARHRTHGRQESTPCHARRFQFCDLRLHSVRQTPSRRRPNRQHGRRQATARARCT